MVLKRAFLLMLFVLILCLKVYAQLQPLEVPKRHYRKIMRKMKQLDSYRPDDSYAVTYIFFLRINKEAKEIIPKDSLLWNIEFVPNKRFVRYNYSVYNQRKETVAFGPFCDYVPLFQEINTYALENKIDWIFFIYGNLSGLFFLVKNNSVQAVTTVNDKLYFYPSNFVIRRTDERNFEIE